MEGKNCAELKSLTVTDRGLSRDALHPALLHVFSRNNLRSALIPGLAFIFSDIPTRCRNSVTTNQMFTQRAVSLAVSTMNDSSKRV